MQLMRASGKGVQAASSPQLVLLCHGSTSIALHGNATSLQFQQHWLLRLQGSANPKEQ